MPMERYLASAVLLAALMACPAAGQTEFEGVQEPAMRLLGAQLMAGHHGAARDSLRAHLARHPGDAVMQYNLACLTAMAGDVDTALEHLERALEIGYRDLNHLLRDPDLASLREHPRFDSMLHALRSRMIGQLDSIPIHLTAGVWSTPLPLLPYQTLPGPEAAAGSLRVRFDNQGLELDIKPPAGGADQAIVTISHPLSLEDYETARWSEYLADLQHGAGLARVARDGQPADRPRADKETVLSRIQKNSTGNASWHLMIPWRDLHPKQPPLELLIGLNVTLRREVGEPPDPAHRWALVRDVFAGSLQRHGRVFSPVFFDLGTDPEPLLVGRLDRYFAVGDTVGIEFGIQGLAADTLHLRLTATAGPATWRSAHTVEGDPELTYATVIADLNSLPYGWFDLSAVVVQPVGRELTWRDRGYRLPPDWFLTRHLRFEKLPEAEKPLVQYHLFHVLRGQQSIHPDQDPTPLATSAALTDTFLDRWDRIGSVLPAQPAICPGAFHLTDDALHPCLLVLPGSEARLNSEIILILTDDTAMKEALAGALHAGRPSDDDRLYVAVVTPASPGNPQAGAAIALRALQWLRELFEPSTIHVAGLGTAANSTLQAATMHPETWSSLLLVANSGFDPWLLSAPMATARLVSMTLGDLPIFLLLPARTTPRTASLASAMADHVSGLVLERRDDTPFDPEDLAARILAWR